MIAARQKEREYFESSPEYGHLSHKMGSEYLAKLLSQVCEPKIATYMVIPLHYPVLWIYERVKYFVTLFIFVWRASALGEGH